MMKSGLIEIPQVYKAKRFEYWHDDVLLVYAVRSGSTSDDELWSIYVHTGILEAIGVPHGSWRDQLKGRVSGYDIQKWVGGLGAVFKAWVLATGNLNALRMMHPGRDYQDETGDETG